MHTTCISSLKITVTVLNCLCALGAIILINLVCIAKTTCIAGYEKIGTGDIFTLIGIIFVQTCIIIIFLIGYLGSRLENKRCLQVYAGTLLGLFVIHFICTIIIFVTDSHQKAKQIYGDNVKKAFKLQQTNEEVKATFDIVQKKFECCGAESYEEYGLRIPSSCCRNMFMNAMEDCSTRAVFKGGCRRKLEKCYIQAMKTIAWTSLIFCIIEFSAAICALNLAFILPHIQLRERLPGDLTENEYLD